MNWLSHPTRFIFFTGKGGVGKTSISTAIAITLADAGKRVLLVSTDAASNLDEMLNVELSNQPVKVPGVKGLELINIDPYEAAQAYRQRVIDQMGDAATLEEKGTVREQLSGACTTEIASFDELVCSQMTTVVMIISFLILLQVAIPCVCLACPKLGVVFWLTTIKALRA